MTNDDDSQTKVKHGWVLKRGDKYWGMICPADGKSSEIYGWTSELRDICISEGPTKPSNKSRFTYAGDPKEIRQMSEGEWVYMELSITYSVKAI